MTSVFAYVRPHGSTELYTSCYTEEALDEWATRIRGWSDAGIDTYAYVDNDAKVRAPRDAIALARRLAG